MFAVDTEFRLRSDYEENTCVLYFDGASLGSGTGRSWRNTVAVGMVENGRFILVASRSDNFGVFDSLDVAKKNFRDRDFDFRAEARGSENGRGVNGAGGKFKKVRAEWDFSESARWVCRKSAEKYAGRRIAIRVGVFIRD